MKDIQQGQCETIIPIKPIPIHNTHQTNEIELLLNHKIHK